jgi:adenosine deaminase
MARAGLRVTLNSDDPALFRTGLREEYRAARRRLGLSPATLYRIHRESIRASFLPAAVRRRLLRESSRIWKGERGPWDKGLLREGAEVSAGGKGADRRRRVRAPS